jgi:hypothetical protein
VIPNTETAVLAARILERLPPTAASSALLPDAALIASAPTRAGTCGNEVCEIGEPCSESDASCAAGCAADCGVVPRACPAAAAGGAAGAAPLPCSARGACRLATGTCACTRG